MKKRIIKWNPEQSTIDKIKSEDKYLAFKTFRSASSGFANRKSVRDYIKNKYSNKCFYCCSTKDLEIDHKISVKRCFDLGKIRQCNTIDNLQLLCRECNQRKGAK